MSTPYDREGQITGQPDPRASGQITDQPDQKGGYVAGARPGAGVPLAGPGLNEKILFWASFLTLIAAGMGASIRSDILDVWGRQFGFTQTDLGQISGMGLMGFGFTIIAFSFFADLVGYGRLMVVAFLLHATAAVLTLAAPFAFTQYGKPGAYYCLYIGALCFSLANGTCEAVINPLTATLFPTNKTHWLNILHAGWPGGLVLGALVGLLLNQFGVSWEVKWGIVLLPVVLYGVMMLGRRFPRSEAKEAGVPMSTMIATLAAPVLLFLFLLHAMVGYVELGTDTWIINITKTVLESPDKALIAFIWTNVLMFTLRFFAGPIVHKISPVGLLFCSAVIGALGLWMLGQPFTNSTWAWMAAVTVYGLGKTFYWPTMLGVISERFPRGGALALGFSGGIGMISAGLLGAPGYGYFQDYAASRYLQDKDVDGYHRYEADTPKGFVFFPKVAGLDNSRVGVLLGAPGADNGMGRQLREDLKRNPNDKNLQMLDTWWQDTGKPHAEEDKGPVGEAVLQGGKKALTWTAAVPAAMAVGYLLLIFYFLARGGYKAEVLVGHAAADEEFTGGTQGPGEG
jgi:hypothetical protein